MADVPWLERWSHFWNSLALYHINSRTALAPEGRGWALPNPGRDGSRREIASRVYAFRVKEPRLSWCPPAQLQQQCSQQSPAGWQQLKAGGKSNIRHLASISRETASNVVQVFNVLPSAGSNQPVFSCARSFPVCILVTLTPFALADSLWCPNAIWDMPQQFLVRSVTFMSILTLTTVRSSPPRWKAPGWAILLFITTIVSCCWQWRGSKLWGRLP